jgi:hypothetical protein
MPSTQPPLLPLDASTLVGRLRGNEPLSMTGPSELCLDDGQLYRSAPARIGDVNLFPDAATDAAIDGLDGVIVAARGTWGASLLDALVALGPCPPGYGDASPIQQMRSDWVAAEGGFRTSRERVGRLRYLRATAIHPVVLVHQRSPGSAEVIEVELRNPFERALDGLEARIHYEGGPGKPMPMLLPLTLALPAGGSQRLELAASVEGGPAGALAGSPRGWYRLYSIDLAGEVEGARFDVRLMLDVPRGRRGRKPGAP